MDLQYLYLVIVVVLIAFQSIVGKEYGQRSSALNAYTFAATGCFFGLLFFLLASGFSLNFNAEVFAYSIFFAVAFLGAQIGSLNAFKCGPMSISMLINSYSLIIPTLHGLIFANEAIGLLGIAGVAFLSVSLYLIKKRDGTVVFSLRWLVYIGISFLGNGFCSVVQKIQQSRFSGEFKNEFMIMAFAVCAFIAVIMAIARKERPALDFGICIRLAGARGLANGIVNLLVMMLTGILPSVILFPSISAGGIIIGFFVSILYYKERLATRQKLGFVLGCLAVVLLNI